MALEEKKAGQTILEEKKFAILMRESVCAMAESAGHSDVAESAAGVLGEDISYRLREITQKSAQFMKHAKRRRLTTDDFNKALRQSDLQPVFGHRSLEPPSPFRQIRDSDVHFTDDIEINLATLAFNSYIPKNQGETSIKAHWLAVEGVQKMSSSTQQSQGKSNGKPDVSDILLKYYDKVTQAILGFDEEIMKTALLDLRTNPRIVPLLQYFVNFISNGVKTVSHDVMQLTKLLHMVCSLINNPHLYLEPQPYLNLLVQAVTQCLLERLNTVNSTYDHWRLRDYAGQILAQIVNIWSNNVNYLQRFTEKTLREALHDHSKPFCTHYGAIMGLHAMGHEAVERVLLPHLSQYWAHLIKHLEITPTIKPKSELSKYLVQPSDWSHFEELNSQIWFRFEAQKVYGAILLCVESILRKKIKEFKSHCFSSCSSDASSETTTVKVEPDVKQEHIKQERYITKSSASSGSVSFFDKSPSSFYTEMYEYFGDTLVMLLPDVEGLKEMVFKPKSKEIIVSLEDRESKKTGEELLDELMIQVRIQEELDRKKREQERIEQEKRKKEEKERLEFERRRRAEELKEQERLENEQRKEAERRRRLAEKERYEKRKLDTFEKEMDVDQAEVKSDRSEKSEEEEQYQTEAPEDMSLAVKSTVSGPGQGIKLTITKRPRLKLNIKTGKSSPVPTTSRESREKDSKHGRKRKQSLCSPKESAQFELDQEQYDFLASHAIYSSEGEYSSDGSTYRKPLTLKLKKKETTSE
ncbi:hypothetical protein ACJMK2_035908 [Sinanodonta woodiana]|uniref:Histone H4 n=1 Tax=Sinanodonta woodiana TaxID=1069815 RepID=A0ABD3WFJ1_SINWO